MGKDKVAAFPSGFGHKMNVGQGHSLVDGLAHVIDGQQSRGHSGQGLHLHPGLPGAAYGAKSGNLSRFPVYGEVQAALLN